MQSINDIIELYAYIVLKCSIWKHCLWVSGLRRKHEYHSVTPKNVPFWIKDPLSLLVVLMGDIPINPSNAPYDKWAACLWFVGRALMRGLKGPIKSRLVWIRFAHKRGSLHDLLNHLWFISNFYNPVNACPLNVFGCTSVITCKPEICNRRSTMNLNNNRVYHSSVMWHWWLKNAEINFISISCNYNFSN